MNGAGAATHWRNIHGLVAHMNLGLVADFAGKWMTPEEKDTMRRIIAKATYGRRSYGQDGPVRFRDVNWMAWDLPQFLAVTAIEGLEGLIREAYASGAETVRAFCDWGIDDSRRDLSRATARRRAVFSFTLLSMVALARRGENLFGHPHWRKLLEAQVQMTSPDGRVTVNSGTQYVPYSRQSSFADPGQRNSRAFSLGQPPCGLSASQKPSVLRAAATRRILAELAREGFRSGGLSQVKLHA